MKLDQGTAPSPSVDDFLNGVRNLFLSAMPAYMYERMVQAQKVDLLATDTLSENERLKCDLTDALARLENARAGLGTEIGMRRKSEAELADCKRELAMRTDSANVYSEELRKVRAQLSAVREAAA